MAAWLPELMRTKARQRCTRGRLSAVVTDAPETHYTRSADGTNLAYQVSGEGPVDLVFNNATGIAIDSLSDDPGFVRVRRRLDSFGRTVWFDRRGWGASEGDPRDSVAGEIFDADLTALLDTVRFERPVLIAEGLAGARAIHFSLTRPGRVGALVLVNSCAHYVQDDDYLWGIPPQSLGRFVESLKEKWGTAAVLEALAPSRLADERFRAWYARSMRFAGGPGQIAEILRALVEDDVRPFLGSILVDDFGAKWDTVGAFCSGELIFATLRLDVVSMLDAGRYLAEHIPTPDSWSSPATTPCSSWASPTRWRTRSRSS